MALLPLLCQIASGKEIKAAAEPGSTKREKIFPTLMERLRAAETLARKIVPDMKAVEYSGPEGENLVIKIVRFGDGDHASQYLGAPPVPDALVGLPGGRWEARGGHLA